MIIDYHLRGQQEQLLIDFPHIKEKAKKFLGFEVFYELGSQPQGIALTEDDAYWPVLLNKQQLIQTQIKKNLRRHDEKRNENTRLPKYEDEEKKHMEFPEDQDAENQRAAEKLSEK